MLLLNSGHPNIRIAGNQALLSSAKIVCTPLGFLPSGSIMLCYDKSVARRTATMYAISNSLKIFEGAVFGAGVAGICCIMKGVFGMYKSALEGTIAAIGTGSILVGAGYTIGSGTSKTQEWASNKIADWSTDGEYGELEEKEKGGGGSDDTVSNLEKGVSTQPGDFCLIPAYHDETELNRQYNVGTQATGEVFDESWKRIKADPTYNKKGISIEEKNAVRNKHMKEVAKELFERNKKIARNDGFWKNVKKGVTDFFIVNLACIGINVAGETAFKISKVALERARDLEAEAQSKVGIYEIKL